MKIINQFRKMSAPTIIQQQNKPNQIQVPIQSQLFRSRKLRNQIRWYKYNDNDDNNNNIIIADNNDINEELKEIKEEEESLNNSLNDIIENKNEISFKNNRYILLP